MHTYIHFVQIPRNSVLSITVKSYHSSQLESFLFPNTWGETNLNCKKNDSIACQHKATGSPLDHIHKSKNNRKSTGRDDDPSGEEGCRFLTGTVGYVRVVAEPLGYAVGDGGDAMEHQYKQGPVNAIILQDTSQSHQRTVLQELWCLPRLPSSPGPRPAYSLYTLACVITSLPMTGAHNSSIPISAQIHSVFTPDSRTELYILHFHWNANEHLSRTHSNLNSWDSLSKQLFFIFPISSQYLHPPMHSI